MDNHKNSTDIVLITALPVEQAAILSRLDSHELAADGTFYQGRIVTKNNRQYSVVVSLMTDMGNMESGITATQLLERFKLK